MKLKQFEYLVPGTVFEACTLLQEYGAEAKILSGGTDIIVRMRDGHWKPQYLIDIKRIPALNLITYTAQEGLTIGATATLNEIAGSDIVQERYPVLAEGAHSVGSLQVRNRATLVGNICNASPLADTAPALLVYNATVTIASPAGERTLPIREFFTGPGTTVLQRGEIVTKIMLPPMANARGCYYKHARRKAVDLASVGVALLVPENPADGVRIALGAVAPVPVRAEKTEALLNAQTITAAILPRVQETIFADISPISDIRSSKEYRYTIATVLIQRGLKEILGLE